MTPTELETFIRQRYNAVGDNFFSQAEIFNYLWAGQMELAQETFCIKNTYTTTSVNGQRAYDYPSTALSIGRVEYDGQRVYPNDFVDDDGLTGNNPGLASTGRPQNYQQWDDQIYFRPAPDTAGLTIKLFTYDLPSQPTAIGSIDVPNRYHLMLVDYALYCMLSKDKNRALASDYFMQWQAHKKLALQTERLRDSGDSLNVVKDIDDLVDDSRFS
jgi:hypothetical protein